MTKEFYYAHCQKHLPMAAYAGDRNGKHQCLECKARVDLHMQGVKTAKLDVKKVKSVIVHLSRVWPRNTSESLKSGATSYCMSESCE